MENRQINNFLSVGIPTFNQGEFLRETIVSLLNQQVAPLEIVVSNNHSTDRTSEVLEEFKGQIRVIKPPQHLGMMQNWNFLVDNLKGTWFTLLSSDDIARTNFVSTLIDGVATSPRAVLVRAGWENIDANGVVVDQRYLLSVRKIVSSPNTFYENLLGPKSSFAAFAVRHDAWRQVGGFPEECRLFGDWAFWIKLSPLGDFIYQHKLLSSYRTNYRPGLQQSRVLEEIKDEIQINLVIIPETGKLFEKINQNMVSRASRKRFLTRLISLSHLEIGNKKTEIISLLKPWASSVNCTKQLKEFNDGKVFKLQQNPLKRYARYLMHYLKK